MYFNRESRNEFQTKPLYGPVLTSAPAVKLGNYLPWDIDGEVFVQSEKMHLLRPGRRAHDVLLREGIATSRHMEDAYWDRGAGYFVMTHRGAAG